MYMSSYFLSVDPTVLWGEYETSFSIWDTIFWENQRSYYLTVLSRDWRGKRARYVSFKFSKGTDWFSRGNVINVLTTTACKTWVRPPYSIQLCWWMYTTKIWSYQRSPRPRPTRYGGYIAHLLTTSPPRSSSLAPLLSCAPRLYRTHAFSNRSVLCVLFLLGLKASPHLNPTLTCGHNVFVYLFFWSKGKIQSQQMFDVGAGVMWVWGGQLQVKRA